MQDRYDYVKRCIDSIIAHTRVPYELILILQAVKDNRIFEYMDEVHEKVLSTGNRCGRFINETNTGVTPGRNQGIGYSSGDKILFFDDDAYVSEDLSFIPENEQHLDWLSRMMRYFWEYPNTGIVSQTGSYINPDTPGTFWECTKRGGYCDVGQGYCFMFSRDVLNSIGTLDPYFGKFWHEESEYSLRAKSKGFKVRDADYIGVTHYGSGSGDDGTYGDKIKYMFNKWKPYFSQILEPKESWNK